MINFPGAAGTFNLRVAAVAVERDRVLLNRAEGEGIWYLPGGRVELMEASREAVKRELREELGVDVRVGRLLWVVENFFVLDGTPIHEVGLYYRVRVPNAVTRSEGIHLRDELGRQLESHWFDNADLASLPPAPRSCAHVLLPCPRTGLIVDREQQWRRVPDPP